MRGKFKSQAVVAAAAAAFLLLAGGAAAQAGGATVPDLSTDEAVYDHLRSLGIDPTGVVIQRGVLNYAGPSCPGMLWNCTTATRVAQIGAGAGENRFECEPSTTGTVPPTVCFTFQSSESGQNHARCVERVTDVTPVKLVCDIDQANVTGGNHALVRQVILQRVGPHQDADEEAYVRQTTGTGHNQVQIHQDISQFTTEAGATDPVTLAEQTQDGLFTADIDQFASGGHNSCHLTQALDQDGRAQGLDVGQHQNGDQDGDVTQDTTGEFGGDVTTLANGEGHSECTAHQRERKTLVGEGAQTQIGPQDCCAEQFGPGTVHIHQDSFARASQPTSVQHLETRGHYVAENGSIVHHLKINDDAITAHESEPVAGALFSSCSGVGDEEGCFTNADPGSFDFLGNTVPAEELAGW